MLDKIRENSRSPLTYAIFGIIILVFIAYFGPGSAGCTGITGGATGTVAWAAKVDGEEISSREYQNAYAQFFESYRRSMNGQMTEAMAEQLKLKETVVDRLVERRLLVALAKKHGLWVSDDELKKELRKIDAFHGPTGAFDFATYKSVVENQIGMTPDKFEDEIRIDLVREKMLGQIRASAKASDDEVRSEWRRDNDRAGLTFLRFTVAQFRGDAAPTDAEVAAFLATPAGKVQVEEEYKKKLFRYKKPKKVKAQHILVKVAEDAPSADVDAARTKLAAAKKEIEVGKEFAAVAAEVSEDVGSKDKGGDLGFFGPGAMAKPFEEAAMALEAGKLSELVRTRFGWHLIKVNEIQAAEEKKLEEVQGELAKELVAADKAKLVAKAKAEEALAKAREGKTLEELFPAPEMPADPDDDDAPPTQLAGGMVADHTGLFSIGGEYIPRIGVAPELARAAAAAGKVGELLPAAYEVSGSWVIAQISDRVQPDAGDYDKRRTEYQDRVMRKKAAALEEGFLKQLRKEAKIELNPTIFPKAGEASTAAVAG